MKVISIAFMVLVVSICSWSSLANNSQASQSAPSSVVSNLININSANVDELVQLPGIGESKANAIIAYRKDKGPFKSLQQLGEVKGIGDKILAKLEGKIAF